MSLSLNPSRRLVVGGGVIALIASVLTLTGCGAAAADTLDAEEFTAAVAEPGVTVLDVRTPAEFDSGHLPGAVNIDVDGADFAATVGALPKDGTYAVYCKSGNRSASALGRMKDLGFTSVRHLGGGIGAWMAAGGQVVKE